MAALTRHLRVGCSLRSLRCPPRTTSVPAPYLNSIPIVTPKFFCMKNSTYVQPDTPNKIMTQLRREEMVKVRDGRKWPEFRVGDKILIKHVRSKSNPQPEYIRGIVMAIRRPNSLTARLIIQSTVEGDILTYDFPLYSPKIESIKIEAQCKPKIRSQTFYKPLGWGVQQIKTWLGQQLKQAKKQRRGK